MSCFNQKLIGKRLRNQREVLALTREQFSEKVGISPQFLSALENGSKNMSIETLVNICQKCNVSADYLLLGKDNKDTVDTPIAVLLRQLPYNYTTIAEEQLRLLLLTIDTVNGESPQK